MPPELEASPGFLLHDVSRLLRRNFSRRIQSLGLTQAQCRALGARLSGITPPPEHTVEYVVRRLRQHQEWHHEPENGIGEKEGTR